MGKKGSNPLPPVGVTKPKPPPNPPRVRSLWENDIPTECECDNTHEANNTVCRYCWENKNHKDKYDGSECVYCHSKNIMAAEQVQCDGPEGSQAVECHDCGRMWYDLWKLNGWMEAP